MNGESHHAKPGSLVGVHFKVRDRGACSTMKQANWTLLPQDVLSKILYTCPPRYQRGPGNGSKWDRREDLVPLAGKNRSRENIRLVCKAWREAADASFTRIDAEGQDSSFINALSSMLPRLQSLTTLWIKSIPLRCVDLNQINQLPNLQHFTYIAMSYDLTRQDKFEPNKDCLLSAEGQRNPLEGFINLRSLHIEEELPNVPAVDLKQMSLLTRLSHLALHCAALEPLKSKGSGRHKRSSFGEDLQVVCPMNRATYRALSKLPNLISLQVDLGSAYMYRLQGLQQLSIMICAQQWAFPPAFDQLTRLTQLHVRNQGVVCLGGLCNLPYLCKASFSFDAPRSDQVPMSEGWTFLRDLRSVQDLVLRNCNLNELAFRELQKMTQLSSLHFTMSKPIGPNIPELPTAPLAALLDVGGLAGLTNLVKLHGKFVSWYRAEDPWLLRCWMEGLPLVDSTYSLPNKDVVLKWHQIDKYSDWIPGYDGDLSCDSSECCHCYNLLDDASLDRGFAEDVSGHEGDEYDLMPVDGSGSEDSAEGYATATSDSAGLFDVD